MQRRDNIRRGDFRLTERGGQAPDDVFQFANVARPAVLLESIEALRRYPFGRQALFARFLQKMGNEIAHVVQPLAQWR